MIMIDVIQMQTVDANDLILLEQRESDLSKEIFNEYSKQNKSLKQIAKEKGLNYNTVKQYSSNYKYKARLELKLKIDAENITAEKRELINEYQPLLKDALDKQYDALLKSSRILKGTQTLIIHNIENIGLSYDDDIANYNKWNKTAHTTAKSINEILDSIEKIENKLMLVK